MQWNVHETLVIIAITASLSENNWPGKVILNTMDIHWNGMN
jgi:hypothetical protein